MNWDYLLQTALATLSTRTGSAVRAISQWLRERRMRIALQQLDDTILKDIGVYRCEIPWIAQQHCR
jgi:uncharacterized protein YjiS (DUF1127 family)